MARPAESAHEAPCHQQWQSPALAGLELFTLDRRRVEILESGTANLDAGPDFLAALLRIDGELVRGDVEIHTRARDWYLHHHDIDPRYNSVILHVVFRPCPAGFAARREDGAAIPTLVLEPLPAVPEEGPLAAASTTPSVCPLAGAPPNQILGLLDRAGMERLEMHAARFLEMREGAGWEEILHTGLFDALGYGKNQPPFRLLARLVPAAVIHAVTAELDEQEAAFCTEALLLGAAGLLPPPTPVRVGAGGDASAGEDPEEPLVRLRRLQACWREAGRALHLEPMPAGSWQFFRLRPCNFPTRRIAAAARLLARCRRRGMLPGLVAIGRIARSDLTAALLALDQYAMVEVDGYWAHHYDLAAHPSPPLRRRRVRLVGRGRSREIAVNVFLPALLAFARESEDGRLSAAVRALYLACPRLPENDLTRRMRRKLCGALSSEHVPAAGAARQQGLIQLAGTRCRRGECGLCLAFSSPETMPEMMAESPPRP